MLAHGLRVCEIQECRACICRSEENTRGQGLLPFFVKHGPSYAFLELQCRPGWPYKNLPARLSSSGVIDTQQPDLF